MIPGVADRVRDVFQELKDQVERLLWERPDASARSAGLRVERAGRYRRVYRDPRFDERRRLIDERERLVKEGGPLAATGGGAPVRPFRRLG